MAINIKSPIIPGTDAEAPLGNPGTDGHFLKSTIAGVRSWGAAGGGGLILESVTEEDSPVACDFGIQYDNIGSTDAVQLDLPAAVRGSTGIRIVVDVAQIVTIQLDGAETARIGADDITTAGGTIVSSLPGSVIRLEPLNTGKWVAVEFLGDWTVS